MFREMRRFKQQLTDDEMLELLKNGKTAVLGVLGDDGYPYTVPVNYVYTNGKIYLHGAKAGHKIDSIKNYDKVSLCIVGKDDIVKEKLTTYFKSVIVFGRARILEKDEDIFFSAESLSLKYNDDKEFVDSEIRREWNILCCIEVTIEHMTGKEAIELTRTRERQAN
ncbi:MAG: pyridoxamine 5'-phosphate oxidase family protein [Filifactoraceae bacterium]